MAIADIIERLDLLSTAPADQESFETWLKAQDAIAFLKDNARDSEFVIYAGLPHTFMHALMVPAAFVNAPDIKDLMEWSVDPTTCWSVAQSFSPARIWITPPLDHTGSKTLDQGEQLVFYRFFERRPDETSYFEVLQKFTQLFALHFIPERNAYCRLNPLGDFEDLIRIVQIPTKGARAGGRVVTFDRNLLDQYMTLTDSVLVRTFDFTRLRFDRFGGWNNHHQFTQGDTLFYRWVLEPRHAGYVRGCQIVRPLESREALLRQVTGDRKENKQFASFIAQDFKHMMIRDISCAPGATATYFEHSDLPFETSAAFFRAEVLAKYKADSEKYLLEDRSITCRGAWHLQTYDINDAGQVHTYLCYLRMLPYEEQLCWKAYNEPPRGTISARAFRTDFAGNWDDEYDPLPSLKDAIDELVMKQPGWWTLRDATLLERCHYPVTSSADEWMNEILHLDQLVVEGFEERWLRQKAQALGRTPQQSWRSLKLLEECLIALGSEELEARTRVAPLRELHDLRSKLKGHAAGQEAAEIKRKIRGECGDYRKHFRKLCTECDETLRALMDVLNDE